MSSGPKKSSPETPVYISMDHEEFGDVCRRVHEMLLSRAEKAKNRRDVRPTSRSEKNHIEAAKDAFAFSHMMELVEAMSEEISNLREIVITSGEMRESSETPEMFSGPKKKFLN